MTNSEIKALKSVIHALKDDMVRLDSVMYSSKDITDKQFNNLRESHDYISNAIDIIDRVIKPIRRIPIDGILAKPVTDFEFSVWALNVCRMNDLDIIADICRLTRTEFLSFRNSGKRTFIEIDKFLKENNLEWGMEV